MNWDKEIDKLKHYVFVEKLSYEAIGRIYNCSGSNIKRVMTRRGIDLPIKSRNAGKIPVNKGTGKKHYCLNCGKELEGSHKYCSNKCCKCGWHEINPYTNTIPLEIDHIDGNAENNSEDNLQLICPNCHSLTSTYRGANRGHGRNITWTIKDE